MPNLFDLPGKGGLRFGPVSDWVHLCVDMQRMFAEDTDWRTLWLPRVLPQVVRLAERAPERTMFTRFAGVPAILAPAIAPMGGLAADGRKMPASDPPGTY